MSNLTLSILVLTLLVSQFIIYWDLGLIHKALNQVHQPSCPPTPAPTPEPAPIATLTTNTNTIPLYLATYTLSELLDAIEQVESGGNPSAIGDNGKSIGSFQLSAPYWSDALEYARRRHCDMINIMHPIHALNPVYSRRIVVWYWQRYNYPLYEKAAKGEATLDDCSRLAALQKPANFPEYWLKVVKELNRARRQRAEGQK